MNCAKIFIIFCTRLFKNTTENIANSEKFHEKLSRFKENCNKIFLHCWKLFFIKILFSILIKRKSNFSQSVVQKHQKNNVLKKGKALKVMNNEKISCLKNLYFFLHMHMKKGVKICRYNEAQKKLKDTVVESKKASWRSFAGTLEARTPTTKVWNTLRAMDGRKKSRLSNQPIRQDTKTFITDRSKAEDAVRAYAQVSKVQIPRTDEKDAYMPYRGGLKTEVEDMDKPITRLDLNTVLGKTKASAPGLDGVHPLMLINLPDEGKDRLLHLINRSWTEGRVPSSWKLACIIPILKKDKPVDEIKSFRPVSLLPSISNAMESLVQIRLKKLTEDHNIIPAEQAGFQPFRSISDVLASICQDAMDGLQRKKRTLLVAVDFKAAFDRVWRVGLLRDLAKHGLSGRCLRWLHSWLADRRSLSKWNNRTSRVKVFSQGTPQGSPLSPLMYCIATAHLPRRIKAAAPTAAQRQFAADLTIGAAADTPGEAATDTQIALNVITEWAAEQKCYRPQKTLQGLCQTRRFIRSGSVGCVHSRLTHSSSGDLQ